MMYVNYCSAPPKNMKSKFQHRPVFSSDQSMQKAAMNVRETDQVLELQFALPGIEKDNVSIQIEGNMLQLSAKRLKDENAKYLRTEFAYLEFQRRIRLSEDLDMENIEAHYQQGILTLKLTKKAKRQNTITVK